MSSYNGSKSFAEKYKFLQIVLYKAVLIFVLSSIAIISMFEGNAQLDTSNSKVRVVGRWKRYSRAATNGGIPYTDFRNSSMKSGKPFWESILPSFECPHELLRKVGDVGDAGKWMCGMPTLVRVNQKDPAPCVVYSTGSNVNSFFEVEMMALTNCTVYSYEPSSAIVDHPLRYFDDRVNLESVLIGEEDNGDIQTLKTLMQKNQDQKWVDVLKLNVMEHGIDTLERILEDFEGEPRLPIGQLLTRLYVSDWESSPDIGDRIVSVFEGLEDRGLRLFYKEISPYYGDQIADFSFINSLALELLLEEEHLRKYMIGLK